MARELTDGQKLIYKLLDQTEKNIRFMALYKPLHTRLSRYVQSLVWQPHEAKDLLSDITLKAFENFEKLKDDEQFIYYLFGIARNLHLKMLRRKKFYAIWDNEKMVNYESNNNSETVIERKELANLLAKLKPVQQNALTLFEIVGFSYEEIAKIEQVSLSKVKTDIYQARQKLKLLIKAEEELLNKAISEPNIKAGGML
ncbi:MAG: RNA polymerase sigma factor [Bacteroidia bacterium]|nr:RNA polymerase sigma factor [Bacteroidia bacterium]